MKRLMVSPWQWFKIKTASGTFQYAHLALYRVKYTDWGPWLYIRVSRNVGQKRWNYDVRFKRKTRSYPKSGCIKGYTYSRQRSVERVEFFLVKKLKLELLTTQQLIRFNLFS